METVSTQKIEIHRTPTTPTLTSMIVMMTSIHRKQGKNMTRRMKALDDLAHSAAIIKEEPLI
jgi:hypothetical protein